MAEKTAQRTSMDTLKERIEAAIDDFEKATGARVNGFRVESVSSDIYRLPCGRTIKVEIS